MYSRLYCGVFWTIVLLVLFVNKCADAIACYTCVSINGSYPDCEDPMSSYVPSERYCKQNIRGHRGLFYARFCTKIKGVNQANGTTLLLRLCSMERLADVDTHCGQFILDEQLYQGCVASCNRDWCNRSSQLFRASTVAQIIFSFIASMWIL